MAAKNDCLDGGHIDLFYPSHGGERLERERDRWRNWGPVLVVPQFHTEIDRDRYQTTAQVKHLQEFIQLVSN